MAFEQRDGRIDRRLSLLARRRMVQLAGLNGIKDKLWENLFEYCKDKAGMSPFWTQEGYIQICKEKEVQPLKLERIVPYFPMTAEYTYYRKLQKQKNKYRSRFGLPNESEKGIDISNDKPLKLNEI